MVRNKNPKKKQNFTCKSCKFTSIVLTKPSQKPLHCPKCNKKVR